MQNEFVFILILYTANALRWAVRRIYLIMHLARMQPPRQVGLAAHRTKMLLRRCVLKIIWLSVVMRILYYVYIEKTSHSILKWSINHFDFIAIISYKLLHHALLL